MLLKKYQTGGKLGKAGTQKEVDEFMMHQKREVLRRKKIDKQTAKDEEYYAERLEKNIKLDMKLDPDEQKWLDEYKMKKGTERKPLKIKRAKGLQTGGKVLQKQSGRESRKRLEGAPDLDDDLWTKFQSRGNLVLPQLLEEQKKRDSGAKIEKARKRTQAIEKATGLKYPESAGGSLPHGEGGKKKKKTTDMPHGAMIKERYEVFKGKMPQHKLMKKAKLLKK